MADHRLDDDAKSRRQGLPAAGDPPRGEVADAWTAKQAVHELYDIDDPDIALDWVRELADRCTDGA